MCAFFFCFHTLSIMQSPTSASTASSPWRVQYFDVPILSVSSVVSPHLFCWASGVNADHERKCVCVCTIEVHLCYKGAFPLQCAAHRYFLRFLVEYFLIAFTTSRAIPCNQRRGDGSCAHFCETSRCQELHLALKTAEQREDECSSSESS